MSLLDAPANLWPRGAMRRVDTPAPCVLVVDDDADLRDTLVDLLRRAGYDAVAAGTGEQAHRTLALRPCALALLDLCLAAEDGTALAAELRGRHGVPIIMMSGRSDEHDRARALDLAADDFVTKPVGGRELVARVGAVLRRAAGGRPGAPADEARHRRRAFGDWILDLTARELRHIDGTPCRLTQAEFALLEAFVAQPRRVLSRDDLIAHTRSSESDVFDRAVDLTVLRLRRKIEPNPRQPVHIRTERGLGYLLASDVRDA